MNKLSPIGLALALALLAGAPAQAQDPLVVRIGHVAPMSGPQAHFGLDNANGARMAIDDLNAKGVTIGHRRATFELVAEDDQADPRQGAAVAQKLCDAKVNGVVGHMNSGTMAPATRIYDACGLPHITPSATNPALSANGYKTFFRLMANDNALGAGLAHLAADKLHLKRVAVIDDRTAYGQGIAEVFKRTAKTVGIEIVSEQFTTDKATDFAAILTAVKSRKPDAIFYGGNDPQAGPMLRQMANLGMTGVKFFGGDGICTTKLAELADGAPTLANVVCAESGVAIEKTPRGADWRKRYDAKFPGQFQVYSPYTYDATMVLADAMVRAGSADPKVYGPLLARTDLDGVTSHIAFDAAGELKGAGMTLYHFVDGKKVALE